MLNASVIFVFMSSVTLARVCYCESPYQVSRSSITVATDIHTDLADKPTNQPPNQQTQVKDNTKFTLLRRVKNQQPWVTTMLLMMKMFT